MLINVDHMVAKLLSEPICCLTISLLIKVHSSTEIILFISSISSWRSSFPLFKPSYLIEGQKTFIYDYNFLGNKKSFIVKVTINLLSIPWSSFLRRTLLGLRHVGRYLPSQHPSKLGNQ